MQITPHPGQATVPSEIAKLDFVPSAVTSQTAAFPPTTSADLTSDHLAHLEGQGIDLMVALEMGVCSVGPRTRGALDDQELTYLLPRGESGLLYPHRSITGGVVPSVRRDNPQPDGEGRTRKYMRPTGAWVAGASPVMMHPRMRQRADTVHTGAYTLLMVEGDKQQLAAVSCAPADVVVVGMPGCAQWHGNTSSSHWEGAAVDAETERLIRRARKVVSAFDADVTTNPAVNREFLRLAQHVRTWCSGDPQLRNVVLPAVNTGSEKAGLDDYLGGVSPAHRTGDLQRLIDTSVVVKKMTKAQIRQRATRKTAALDPYVDWDEALVRGAGHEDIETGMVKDGPVLLACAIRIKAVHVVQHDMTPGARPQRLVDVELRVPHYDSDGQMIRDEEPEVLAGLADSLLDTPTEILALSGDPAATGVAVHPRLTADIAQAIRATVAGAEWRTVYNRTGWIATPERVAYLTPAGAMTCTGVLEDVSAHFNAAARNRSAAALLDPLVGWSRQHRGLVEIDEGGLWRAAFGRVEDPYDTGTLAQMWPVTLDVGESWSGPLGMHSDACVGTAIAGYA